MPRRPCSVIGFVIGALVGCFCQPADGATPGLWSGATSLGQRLRLVLDGTGQNVVQISSPDVELQCRVPTGEAAGQPVYYPYSLKPVFTTTPVAIVNDSFSFSATISSISNSTYCDGARLQVSGTLGQSGNASGALQATGPSQCQCLFPSGTLLTWTAAPAEPTAPVFTEALDRPGGQNVMQAVAVGSPDPIFGWQEFLDGVGWRDLTTEGSYVISAYPWAASLTLDPPDGLEGRWYRAVARNIAATVYSDPLRYCRFTMSPSRVAVDTVGGSATVSVVPDPLDCEWVPTVSDPVNLSTTAISTGTPLDRRGTWTVSTTANIGAVNQVTWTRYFMLAVYAAYSPSPVPAPIASSTVEQGGCSFYPSTFSYVLGADGGPGNITVIATGPCPWSVGDLPPWITTTSGGTGTGPGTWQFRVEPTPIARSHVLRLAGSTVTLYQLASSVRPVLPGTRVRFTVSSAAVAQWFSIESQRGSFCAMVAAAPTETSAAMPILDILNANLTPASAQVVGVGVSCFWNTWEARLVRVSQQENAPRSYALSIVETTLRGNWFYAEDGYASYTILRNVGTDAQWVDVEWRDSAGSALTSHSRQLGPGETVALQVGQPTTALHGSVEVLHQGKPGTIIGSQTTLSPVTGLSFDTPLATRQPW